MGSGGHGNKYIGMATEYICGVMWVSNVRVASPSKQSLPSSQLHHHRLLVRARIWQGHGMIDVVMKFQYGYPENLTNKSIHGGVHSIFTT